MNPLAASGGKSRVRLEKRPVPTWLSQMSNSPSRSARKATNFPSGEISAPSSVPSQSVKRVNWALASGFSGVGHRAPGLPHADTGGERDERDPRQPRRAGLRRSGRRRRHVGDSRQRFVDRVDLDPDVTDISQTLLGILREAAAQESSNDCRCRRGEGRPVGLTLENLPNRVRHRLAGKGDAPGQHLVEHAAERPDVGALVDHLPTRLFRAHVGGRAENRPLPACRRSGRTPTPSALAGFASPKSSTFTTPSGVILMFAGFRSRWMIPLSCATSSASAICRAIVEHFVNRQP